MKPTENIALYNTLAIIVHGIMTWKPSSRSAILVRNEKFWEYPCDSSPVVVYNIDTIVMSLKCLHFG